MTITITPDIISRGTGATPAAAQRWSQALAEAMQAYQINTPARAAAFLAQLGHESGRLRYTSEIWGPTAQQMRYEREPSALWARRDSKNPATHRNSLAFELGNSEPGDGSRYRGRGLIQVTGRFNYGRRRDRLRARLGADAVPDFEAQPELLAEPAWAALSAADYWDEKGLNALADAGDFELITRRINGGLNGYADRLKLWEQGKAALAAVSHASAAPDRADSNEPAAHQAQEAAPPPSTVPTPSQPDPAPAPSQRSTTMSAFIPAAFAAIAEAVPSLIRLFGSSEVSERNAKAAELVVNVAKEATGARNEQELIETLKADPAAAALVADAVQHVWYQIAVDTSGIEGARAANSESMAKGERPWMNPALWITILLLPLVYLTVYFVLTRGEFNSEVKSMVVASVVSGVLSAVAGYWLGTSFSSSRKTEQMQQPRK